MMTVLNDDLIKGHTRNVDVEMSERTSPCATGYRRMSPMDPQEKALQSYEAPRTLLSRLSRRTSNYVTPGEIPVNQATFLHRRPVGVIRATRNF